MPPTTELRFIAAASARGFSRLDRISASAPTATAASAIRAAENVSGSMCSMPTRWATNAVPQIIAVSASSALPSIRRRAAFTCV